MFQSKKPNSSRGVRHVRKFRLRTDVSRDMLCSRALKYATTPRNCWTRYPPRYSNGWAEFWSEPMKPLANKPNHAHWLRIIHTLIRTWQTPKGYHGYRVVYLFQGLGDKNYKKMSLLKDTTWKKFRSNRKHFRVYHTYKIIITLIL